MAKQNPPNLYGLIYQRLISHSHEFHRGSGNSLGQLSSIWGFSGTGCFPVVMPQSQYMASRSLKHGKTEVKSVYQDVKWFDQEVTPFLSIGQN